MLQFHTVNIHALVQRNRPSNLAPVHTRFASTVLTTERYAAIRFPRNKPARNDVIDNAILGIPVYDAEAVK